MLNNRGQEIVRDMEQKEIEKQHIILQYVLSSRGSLFNEKGRKLNEIVTKKGSEVMTQDTLNDLIQSGFDENDIGVLFYLHQEKELYDGSFARKLRKTGRDGIERVKTALGIETRIEPVEYKYTFNAKGELVSAEPHVRGQPYHGAKQLRWIDAHGQVRATAQPEYMHTQAGSGYVVKMTQNGGGSARLRLINPQDIEIKDYKSFVADLFLSSAAPSDDFQIDIDYHTSFAEQGGQSWFCQLGVKKDQNRPLKPYIFAQCNNKNTSYQYRGSS